MCCPGNRRTCVIGISVFCIVITAISAINIVPGISAKLKDVETEFYGDHKNSILATKIVIYLIVLLCYTLCLVGAIKRKPLLLLPFMVLKCIMLIAAVVGAGTFVYYGGLAHYFQENPRLLVIASLIYLCHWLFVYFLYVVIKLYKDLRIAAEEETGLSMQQIYSKN